MVHRPSLSPGLKRLSQNCTIHSRFSVKIDRRNAKMLLAAILECGFCPFLFARVQRVQLVCLPPPPTFMPLCHMNVYYQGELVVFSSQQSSSHMCWRGGQQRSPVTGVLSVGQLFLHKMFDWSRYFTLCFLMS